MSDRKLFGILSGAHITILGCVAILAPTALYAVTYTSVAVTDPVNGKVAAVDAGNRLYVYDPIAGYANNPYNLVEVTGNWDSVNSSGTIYTVPAGKALILKTVNFSYYNGVNGNDNYAYFFNGPSEFIGGFDDVNGSGAHVSILGSGFYLHAGDSISVRSDNGGGTSLFTFYSIEGYLVPSNAVPAVDSPEAAQHVVNHGGAHKKL